MNNEEKTLRADVMNAIRKGRIQMRPRWQFILISTLTVVGVLIVILALLYIVSLAVFFLRDSGVFFAPSFGARGWWALLRDVPWLLVLLVIPFFVVLELLVKRYAFVYRKPLLVSVAGILILIFAGGFAIALTPFHHQLSIEAREGMLPPPVGFLYRSPLRMPPPNDTYHGEIASLVRGGFVMMDENGAGTTTVLFGSHTRLPYGSDFTVGEEVVVVGDRTGSTTVQAFGIREVGE